MQQPVPQLHDLLGIEIFLRNDHGRGSLLPGRNVRLINVIQLVHGKFPLLFQGEHLVADFGILLLLGQLRQGLVNFLQALLRTLIQQGLGHVRIEHVVVHTVVQG